MRVTAIVLLHVIVLIVTDVTEGSFQLHVVLMAVFLCHNEVRKVIEDPV